MDFCLRLEDYTEMINSGSACYPMSSPVSELQLILIAVVDENLLLADANGIPWHLPRDVAHFRACTEGQWLLLGKRTYQEMHGWFKPNHKPLVLTNDTNWQPTFGIAFTALNDALEYVRKVDPEATKVFCCGGGMTYVKTLPFADRMILSRVHYRHPISDPSKAVYFPQWDSAEWKETRCEYYPADSDNVYPMEIITLERI